MSKEGHDVSHIIDTRQRDANYFRWYRESRVSVTAEGLTLEHINNTNPEFGIVWIHRIGGHDDMVEIKMEGKNERPNLGRSMMKRRISQPDTK